MKLSKLDPMMLLMLVVAFGVVLTMLTQNSVASVDRASLQKSVVEKAVSIDMKISETRVSGGYVNRKMM